MDLICPLKCTIDLQLISLDFAIDSTISTIWLQMDGRMEGWMDGRMKGWIKGWTGQTGFYNSITDRPTNVNITHAIKG